MIVLKSTVRAIAERFSPKHVSGVGKEATFLEQSSGWFLHLDGLDPIWVGKTEPKSIKVGDRVKLTIEKEFK